MSDPLRIVFMGTPDFAVPSLLALNRSPHDVCWVVTQPDRPKGRGRTSQPPPVKTAAEHLGYPVTQPVTIKSVEFMEALKMKSPDLIVVIAFGRILPPSVLMFPRLRSINVHASLLPKFRGPAPIQRAMITGEKKTGVTLMRLDQGLDTGDILSCQETDISDDETAGMLHDRLALMGADLLLRTIEPYAAGTISPILQHHELATYAPLLKKDDGKIPWNSPAETIACFIRGMTPWPGAFTFLKSQRLKIHKARILPETLSGPPGTIVKSDGRALWVAAGTGTLSILEIQIASGKKLPIQDFLRGFSVREGSILE